MQPSVRIHDFSGSVRILESETILTIYIKAIAYGYSGYSICEEIKSLFYFNAKIR